MSIHARPSNPSRAEDYWATGSTAGIPWTPGPKFASEGTGLRVNGVYRNYPVAGGIRVATLPDNRVGYPIDVTPYIIMRNSPGNPISIRIGDNLGLLRMTQTNNAGSGSSRLAVTYVANNNFTISPSTCTINNNNPIEINFGQVNQRAIGSDPLTTPIVSNRRLTYSCPSRRDQHTDHHYLQGNPVVVRRPVADDEQPASGYSPCACRHCRSREWVVPDPHH